jgi:endo-1,4-beta-D-glucanase Y
MALSFRVFILLLSLSAKSYGFNLHASQDISWQTYVHNFVTPSGRVIDTGNNNISHTEGQGWAMLMAVAFNDKLQFEKIWQWTNAHLRRPEDNLFSWRYQADADPSITDRNNASDGDILIAWALSLAASRWDCREYREQSAVLRQAIGSKLVMQFGGYTVLLPADDGFEHDGYININLSYIVVPALQHFAELEPSGAWQVIIDDAQVLFNKGRFGRQQLPADWLQLYEDGHLSVADKWPARFGYEAIRIPLYFLWGGLSQSEGLQSIADFWSESATPPAWIALGSEERAEYSLSKGGMAVRYLLLGEHHRITELNIEHEKYYSASLLLLSRLAADKVSNTKK